MMRENKNVQVDQIYGWYLYDLNRYHISSSEGKKEMKRRTNK